MEMYSSHDGSMVLVYMLTLGGILMGSMLLYIAAPLGSVMGLGKSSNEMVTYSDCRRAKIAEAAAARRERGRFEWQDLSTRTVRISKF